MLKQVLFVILIMGILLVSACSTTGSTVPVPPEVERQIYALSEGPVSGYISIIGMEDDGSLCRVNIELLFEPETYSEVAVWTDAVCYDIQSILESAGLQRDISVWAKRTLGDGRVVLYGRTYYSRGRYEFKSAEELDL